jgi:hypothetical protein
MRKLDDDERDYCRLLCCVGWSRARSRSRTLCNQRVSDITQVKEIAGFKAG